MPQGYVATFPPNTGETFGNYASKARINQSAVNTHHKGGSAPTSPEVGQAWIDDTATPWTLKFWDGAAWKTAGEIITQFAEILAARGTAGSLDVRISVSLNPDGTLKASTSLSPSEWLLVAGTPVKVNATTFTIGSSDLTGIFTLNRRVLMSPTAYGTVASSSSGAGTTTVVLAESTVPDAIASASVSLVSNILSTASLNAKSIRSPSGNFIEDYLLEIIRGRRGLDAVLSDFDEDPATTTGLTWGYKAGILPDGTIKGVGTLGLTDAATNYVELDGPTGTISANTTGFTQGRAPLRVLGTSGGAITSSSDRRPWFQVPGASAEFVRGRRGLTMLLQDFDEDPTTTTGLTWGHKAGILANGSTKAAGTIALGASVTTYVELDPSASGTFFTNTSAFSAGRIPIRTLVTHGSAITSSVDNRPLFAGVGGSSSGGGISILQARAFA